MSGIKIPVGATFDQASVDQALQGFLSQLNRLGSSIAQANKVQFRPVDKATVQDMQKITASFENLRKISGDLNKRLKSTGQSNAGFLDVDWAKLYADPHSRARQMQKAFEYVVGNHFAASQPTHGQGPSAHRAPPSSSQQASSSERNRGGAAWAGVGVQIAQGGLRGAGGPGNVAAGALGRGMSGGVGAGLAGLVGGIAALALGRAVSAVIGKVGEAQQELIGFDTLKRTLGDVNVQFGALKESLRNSARHLDMTFDETLRLGTEFTKISGLTQDQYRTLQDEVNNAGGFARSFGLDPSQSTAFFAQMRKFRVTGNSQESRDLALMIAEGVARAGTFSKMDEVLEAIAGFTAQQTRTGMNTANVTGYVEFLTGLMGSGRAGLGPASAAALLTRLNASIAAGGANGEAGQNFLFSALGSRLGLNPIQTKILQEQGAFGTGAATFGEGSMYSLFASRFGLQIPGAAGSGATNLQLIKEKLEEVYAGQPELMADAMANLFGVNISQAMALASIDGQALGGLSARLRRTGVNINDVNATGISRISQIEADSSLSEGEKDRLIREAASQHQEDTDGSKTRASINGVERAIVDMAGALIGPINVMRDGIIFLAGQGRMSTRQVQQGMAKIDSRERLEMVETEYQRRIREAGQARLGAQRERLVLLNRNRRAVMSGEMTPEEHARQMQPLIDKEQAAIRAGTEAREWRRERIAEDRRELERQIRLIRGEERPTTEAPAAPASAEQGSGPYRTFGAMSQAPAAAPGAQSSAGSSGLANVRGFRNNNPGNLVAGVRWQGKIGSDGRFAIFDTPENGYRAMGKNLLAYQNRHGLNTIRQIISRWAPPMGRDQNGNPYQQNTAAYIAAVSREMGVGPDEPLDLSRQATLQRLMTSITRHENGGLKHDASVISVGARRALGLPDEPDAGVVAGRPPLPSPGPAAELPSRRVPAPVAPEERTAPARSIMRSDAETATPLPAGARPGDSAMGRQSLDVRIVAEPIQILGQTGMPAAPPVGLSAHVGSPRPSGVPR